MRSILFGSLLAVVLIGIGIISGIEIFPQKQEEEIVVSPVPDFLSKNKNSQVATLSLFLPHIFDSFSSPSLADKVRAQSALVFDLETEQAVVDRNSKKRLPMASLTKIMTAIIALEHPKSDDRYIVSKSHLVGENSMGVTTGETLSLQELLYGLILVSGNDAAEVLAGNYEGGRTAFVDAMNQKAEALGLSDTHFTNPSGLQGDGTQYTTAYDLLVITRYAIEHFPEFTEVSQTVTHEIPNTADHKYFYLENETNLLTSYPGVKGIKTGFTPEAGLCLVTYLEYKDHRMIGILLGSENRRQEMKDLLDYSLEKLGTTPPKHT